MTKELIERELQNTSINDVSLADYIKENYVPIKVLDKIRAKIAEKIVIRPALNHSRTERDRNDAFLEVLDIIDKYRKESEEA